MRVLVVTGLSGAGKSTSLRALEDLGFYCVDNVPVPLLPELVDLVERTDETRRLAVGVDAREAGYLERFPDTHRQLRERGHSIEVLFLEARSEVLLRRYSATRRKHPMGELPQGIERERRLLSPIREVAAEAIDSSSLSERQLRQLVRDRYGTMGTLQIVLMSFAFRHGVPSEADIVFDCRFLANPHDLEDLRPLSGLHEPVARFVMAQEDARSFVEKIEDLLRFVVPRSSREGRSYLTVGLGCTGGQHRSVALVEELKRRLMSQDSEAFANLVVRHRDVGGG